MLAGKLDRCKKKENIQVDRHIQEIQEAYWNTNKKHVQPTNLDKGKQWEDVVQDEKVFLYKSYNISLEQEWSKTLKSVFMQEEVNNLEKVLWTLQSPVKTIPFYPPLYYKSLWKYREQDKQC